MIWLEALYLHDRGREHLLSSQVDFQTTQLDPTFQHWIFLGPDLLDIGYVARVRVDLDQGFTLSSHIDRNFVAQDYGGQGWKLLTGR